MPASFRIAAPLLVALIALLAAGAGLWRLAGAEAGLDVTPLVVGPIPARVYRPVGGAAAPVVVVAHGFAGSQQMMQPLAITLARAGFVAVTFDFPGHGRNPVPLAGGLTNHEAALRSLTGALDQVARAARPLGDGRLAVVGHSLGAHMVLTWALDGGGAEAVVAISTFAPGVTATAPRNLQMIVGGWEPARLQAEARRVAGGAGPGATSGEFAAGTARRFDVVAGVEHIGILWAAGTGAATRDWLCAAFGRPAAGAVEARGPAIGLMLLGLIALGWPLARVLPRVTPAPEGGGLPWRRFWPVAVLPAVATPLLLAPVPGGWLPLLLGDYLALHCAVHGVLTLALLRWRGGAWPVCPRGRAAWGAAGAVAAWLALGLGAPLDRWVMGFLVPPGRTWLVPILLAGTLPFFLGLEWACRGPHAARGAGLAVRALFLLSLVGAIALDPPRLFFLAVIVPVMLAFLVVYGLAGRWAAARTGSPLPAVLAQALAAAMAATFPLVGGG